MIAIKSKKQPKKLIEFKKILFDYEKENNKKVANTFDYLKDDKITTLAVQKSLAAEQGFICCYCMSEIKIDENSETSERIQIEHFMPKSVYNGNNGTVDLRIEYSNFLGGCLNNKTCGSAKKDYEFQYITNPKTTKNFNLQIKYIENTGKIKSLNEDINFELNDKLNLNDDSLREKRKSCLNAIYKRLKEISKSEDWQKDKDAILEVNKIINSYSKKDKNGKYKPHFDFIITILKSKFKSELEKS